MAHAAEDDAATESTKQDTDTFTLLALKMNTMRTVNLTRCADSPSLDAPSLVSLARAIARADRVVTVNLSGQPLDVSACHALSRASADGASFRVLDCGDCALGDAGVTELADVLILNASLEQLYVPNNDIGKAGAKALSSALLARPGPRLNALDLSDNANVGDEGAIALAAACQTGRSARAAPIELRLSGCGIGDAGAEAFGRALLACDGKNQGVHFLCLDRNDALSPSTRVRLAGIARETEVKLRVAL
jgi:Ran GTPase-activating protein (RanGAP) involved in mRNA processing and transport